MSELPDIKNFAKISAEIRHIVNQQSWFTKHGVEYLKTLLRFCLFAIGYFIFSYQSIYSEILGIVVMSYAYTGICITGIHEASHRAFSEKTWVNKALAYFFTDFWTSKSSDWWYHRHIVTHHPYPNDPVKEPKPFYFPWINKYAYFFVVPYLIVPWLFLSSVIFLWGKWSKLIRFLCLAGAGYFLQMYLFISLGYSVGTSFFLVFIMRSVFAPIFMHLAVFNHIGLSNPEKRLSWISQQTLTTRNIKPNWFLSGLGGNAFLDGHLEHHLFPGISNHMISKVRPLLVKYLNEQGYLYVEEGYLSCLKHCLKYYRHLFEDLPTALW